MGFGNGSLGVRHGNLDSGFSDLSCRLLAMAEMAIGASRNTHLAIRAEQGKAAASVVIGFRQNASRLLGTTQLGITALAMLSGIYGEALWVPRVEAWLQVLNLTPGLAYALALGLVVTVITFFSLVFGEVIPKRLALSASRSSSGSLVRRHRIPD